MASQTNPYHTAQAPFGRFAKVAFVFTTVVLLVGGAGGCGGGRVPEATMPNGASERGAQTPTNVGVWQSLFNGENLAGWRNPYDWGQAWVEDGEIRLRADEKFFLVTEETFGDFVFEGEVHLPDTASNSGFMFRANVEPNRVFGYQAEVDPSARQWAGGLYDEGRRGWLHPAEGDEAAGAEFRTTVGQAFDPEAWNQYRIRAEGDSIKIWVNGQKTTAYRDGKDRRGVIGIQHHGEAGKVYRFRNLRLRRLGRSSEASAGANAPLNTLTEVERTAGWKLLFDGKSFDGWTAMGTGDIPEEHWQVEGGAIKKLESDQVPTAPDGQPLEGGDIMTEQTYRDFELKWEWKVAQGSNSGLKYNVSEAMSTAHEPKRAALGFEYQILDDERHPDAEDPTHRASALYDLIRADPAQKNLRPPGEWNHSRLVFLGSHGEHWLNGEKVLEYDLDSARFDSLFAESKYAPIEDFAEKRSGHIVLQDHSDTVWFRNIKLRNLPPPGQK